MAPDPNPTPPPPAPAPPPAPSSPPNATTDAPRAPAWYRDVIGDALVGGGAVILVMGAVVYASAVGKLDDADAAKTYAAQQDLVDKAHTDRLFSVLLVASGAALVAGGIYHYVRYTDAATGPQIGLVPTKGGAFASFAMRF